MALPVDTPCACVKGREKGQGSIAPRLLRDAVGDSRLRGFRGMEAWPRLERGLFSKAEDHLIRPQGAGVERDEGPHLRIESGIAGMFRRQPPRMPPWFELRMGREYGVRLTPRWSLCPRPGQAPARILGLLQRVETLPESFWIAGPNLGNRLAPTMPQLRGFDGRIPPSGLRRQPPEETLHLPFDLCWIPCHPLLLAPGLMPEQGYYVADNPGSYCWPYP